MEIIFKPKAGELCSFFASLHFSWNVELMKDYIEMFGATFKEDLKAEYYNINQIQSNKKEQMDFFFNNESKIFKVFMVYEKFWECDSIEEYLEFLEGMNEESLRVILVKTLIDDKLKNDDTYIEAIAKVKEETLLFIKSLELSKASKWDLFCLLDNLESYKKKFIVLLKEYIPTFNKFYKKQRKFIDKTNEYIMENIEAEGLDFVKAYSGGIISLEGFEKVYLASSYFDSYLIFFTLRNNTKDCYLVVGPYHQELVNQKDNLEAQLKVFKNLCDKTRFGIMKYIMDSKRYGQEIAQKFNISNASVSYHMQNLLFLNLVEISKKDNKVFYKLNRKRLEEVIRFLEEEFGLDYI